MYDKRRDRIRHTDCARQGPGLCKLLHERIEAVGQSLIATSDWFNLTAEVLRKTEGQIVDELFPPFRNDAYLSVRRA